jgi:hypothetical protein
MKQILWLLILMLLTSNVLFGNIAAPVQTPEKIGDLFTSGKLTNPLRIEKETLLIDTTGTWDRPGMSRAAYDMVNPAKERISLPMLFLTPGATEIAVSVNGSRIESKAVTIPAQSVPWAADVSGKLPSYGAASFEVAFEPGEKKTIEVGFRISSGYDNSSGDRGMTAAQAAHATNQFKGIESTSWYRYDLFASSSFGGGFGSLDLTVKVPNGYKTATNLALEKSSEDNTTGFTTLTGTFGGIPASFIDIKNTQKVEYNFIGGTVGVGWAFPFDGRSAHFYSKLLLDIYAFQHQVSLGLELDPFDNMYHGLLLYTIFPPGKMQNYGWFFDVRGGAGVSFDFASSFNPGFVFFGGFKIIPVAYEVFYEIFPFRGSVNQELGITIEIGI